MGKRGPAPSGTAIPAAERVRAYRARRRESGSRSLVLTQQELKDAMSAIHLARCPCSPAVVVDDALRSRWSDLHSRLLSII